MTNEKEHSMVTKLLDGSHCPRHGMEWEACCLSEVSLEIHSKVTSLLATVRKEEREAAFKDAMKIIDEAGEEWGVQARDRKSKTYSAYVLAALDLKGRIEAAATENRKREG